ncbi:MAG: glycosyltransferase family 39 protein, partial [Dehalococcoidaceae bacterium]|nr:glycosyltransferase family 39 protein [Dehalococcoidaceae bacterium]
MLCLVAFLHFSIVMTPGEYVFDEKYYVGDALNILEGSGSARPEHPPLGRLIITAGVAAFGNNPFGWRVFPVLSGIAGLVLMYLVCRELRLPEKLSLLAVFLLATENLSFIQSSIAMLDVFSLTFMLGAFLAYLKGRHAASGVLIGLSMLAKFTGIFAIAGIGLHWLITNRKRWLTFSFSMALAPVVYLCALPFLLYIIWGKLLNPVTETITMLSINISSTFSLIQQEALSRPWEWVFGYNIITYWPEPHYMAMISSSIWALILPAMGYMLYKARKGSQAAVFSLVWFGGTYLLWIPVSLLTDRTSYIF